MITIAAMTNLRTKNSLAPLRLNFFCYTTTVHLPILKSMDSRISMANP
jgi:hypothetical protein